LRGFWRDLTFGLRTQLKTPAVTAAILVTLAFGIAANSIAFSLVNSFFLRPLPVQQPQRLVRIYSGHAGGFAYFTLSYADYEEIGSLAAVFSAVIADEPAAVSLRGAGASERIWGCCVSTNYFSVLGVRPVRGRFFGVEERRGSPAVVLSYGLWRRVFGAQDADIVRLVARQALALVSIGLVFGIVLGLAGARFLRGLLYGVGAADPLVFGAAPVVLVLVSLVACSVPAWRATRLDAARALRYE
jgi:hypothetical protein